MKRENPPSPVPQDQEIGIVLVGSTRVRCILDPDWGSVMCFRIAPGELSDYLGVLTGPDTDSPNLHLVSESRWRFPTPELREGLRQSVYTLYQSWRASQ
ncbi:hypothetical protein [Glycomyces sp. NPDC048151]|uniref:hypothetical protein n=1 Tax=Glycomyces sp. NPDC048151 TaxID=3364002 RepID=UPI0037220554